MLVDTVGLEPTRLSENRPFRIRMFCASTNSATCPFFPAFVFHLVVIHGAPGGARAFAEIR